MILSVVVLILHSRRIGKKKENMSSVKHAFFIYGESWKTEWKKAIKFLCGVLDWIFKL